jgi:hypothetical protein
VSGLLNDILFRLLRVMLNVGLIDIEAITNGPLWMCGFLAYRFAQFISQDLETIFTKVNHVAVRICAEEILLLWKRFVPGFAKVMQHCFAFDGPIGFAVNRAGGELV